MNYGLWLTVQGQIFYTY